MAETVIRVEGLGKRYAIGAKEKVPKTKRETLARAIGAPFKYLRSITQEPSPEEILWALKDVSFEVTSGEVVGIIGRNGAGKSTLLKILSRITKPSTGYAEIRGRVGSLLEVGTGFHPELTGRENIYLNGSILGMRRWEIDKQFDEIVAFAEVERFLDTPVKRYSSGMYVRLAFAVAAHLEPEILIVDEVLAVGDAAFQRKCLGKMGDVAQGGRTVLFVSHNMSAVQELCTQVIQVERGQISNLGAPSKVIGNYLSSLSDRNEGDIDLSNPALRRNSLSTSAFLWKNIKILNAKQQPSAMLGFGEPFTIVLEGYALTDLSFLRVGFAVMSVSGAPLFNAIQSDYGLPTAFSQGLIRFIIKFDPNLLAPGFYEISLGANGDKIVDWLPVAMSFQITEENYYPDITWAAHSAGHLRYPCSWFWDS